MNFDQKIAKLSLLGFKQNKRGITDLRYTFTYEQIDELSSIELDEFINEILKTSLKEHIDFPFNNGDLHNHSFVGTIVDFKDDLATVEDMDGDCFDIEIERLTYLD